MKYCSFVKSGGWNCPNVVYLDGLCRNHHFGKGGNRKRCSVEGCERAIHGYEFCTAHLHRWQRFGDDFDRVTPIKETKRNTKKTYVCFMPRCENPSTENNLCSKHQAHQNKHKIKFISIVGDWESGCESCGSLEDLCLDHDHSICPEKSVCEKCYRGILCRSCNLAAGYLQDSPEKIMGLAMYLVSKIDILEINKTS